MPGQLEARVSQLKSQPPPKREKLAAHLLDYNAQMGASQATFDNINKLAEGALVVMTGQQPGLLTGPLYTIYKAISCLRLARHIAKTYHCPCVPVFWNAAEDHDLAEVNRLYMLNREDEWQYLELNAAKEYQGQAVGRIPLEGWDELWGWLDNILPDTDFKSGCKQLLQESWETSANWGEWFSRLMLKLFGKYGLVLVDPNQTPIRQLMSPVLEQVLKNPLLPARLTIEAAEKLQQAGYKIQLRRAAKSCSFFIFEYQKRQPVSFSDGRFYTPGASYSPDELSSMLQQEPERFSPSVVLRPIMADYMFNTAVYVAGPGEIAYFPQLKAVYEYLQVAMPLIRPRTSLSIIETRIGKVLRKCGLSPIMLQKDVGQIMSELTRQRSRLAGSALWEQTRHEALEPLRRLRNEALAQDQSLAAAIESAMGKIAWQLNQLESKTIQLYKKKNSTLTAQLKRAKSYLFPEQQLQERRLNLFYFLNKYGLDWLDGLVECTPLEYGAHHFMGFTISAL